MTIYTYQEALEESIKYFKGDELAASVWIGKYAMKDSLGNLYENSPEQMHRRLANEFARIEAKYSNPMSADEIYDLLKAYPGNSPVIVKCSKQNKPFQLGVKVQPKGFLINELHAYIDDDYIKVL